MKPFHRGIAVAALQCLIILGIAGKYTIDRERLPRAWARTLPFDPTLPIRGRYVRLRLEVNVTDPLVKPWSPVQLAVEDGRLVALPGTGARLFAAGNSRWALQEPVAFFIPDAAADPSRRAPGEELWVEVSVPAKGPPRPIALGVKKDGVLTPYAGN